MAPVIKTKTKKPETKTVRILKIVGLIVLFVFLVALLLNSMLCIFADHYYPTWGRYRLFAIVSDSMEPTIKKGNMIAATVPESSDEIQVGTVITFEYTQNDTKILITHRVIAVNADEQGNVVNYTTRGDNAPGVDAYRPVFGDIVGVFGDETKQCGFFGYFFGFLQSAEGTIALILTLMIALIAYIVVRFINIINTWRQVAVAALKKSGDLLSGTDNEDLVTIADVIGIVTKDPLTRAEQRRKDKKLDWFIRTGMLPKRPYADDLDVDLANLEGKEVKSIKLDKPADNTPQNADETVETVNADGSPKADGFSKTDGTASKRNSEQADEEDASNNTLNPAPQTVTERNEKISYAYSFMAKLSQLTPQVKEWYSQVKNELLSYVGVRVKAGNKFETFSLSRRTVARLTVRGKTLCIMLAIDPATCAKKYAVETSKSSTPCLYRLKSARRVKYSAELIAGMMSYFNASKNADYVPSDFYVPYEGVVTLMNKKLVKRRLRTSPITYKVHSDGKTEEV